MATALGTPSAENLYPEICRRFAAKGFKPEHARDPWYPRERTPEYVRDLIAQALSVDMPKHLQYDFKTTCSGIQNALVEFLRSDEAMLSQGELSKEVVTALWNAPKVIEPFLVCLIVCLSPEEKRAAFLKEFDDPKKLPGLYRIVEVFLDNGLCPFAKDIMSIATGETEKWRQRSALENAFRTAYDARNRLSHGELEPPTVHEAIQVGDSSLVVLLALVEHNIKAITKTFRRSDAWEEPLLQYAERKVLGNGDIRRAHRLYQKHTLKGTLDVPQSVIDDEDDILEENTNPPDNRDQRLSWDSFETIIRPGSNRKVMVVGPGGSGKTTFLHYLAWEGATRYKDDPKCIFPVYLSLSRYSRDISEGGLKKTIESVLELESDCFASLLRKGQCLLILDGFNEVRASHHKQVAEELCAFLDRYGSAAVVVSSRHAFQLPQHERAFDTLTLKPFDNAEARLFVDALCRDSKNPELSGHTDRIWRRIQSLLGRVHNLRYPFMLSVMVQVHSGTSDRDCDSQAEIFREYVAQLLHREFTQKQGTPAEEVGMRIREYVLAMSELAFAMVKEEILACTPSDKTATELWQVAKEAGLADHKPGHGAKCSFQHEDIRDYFAAEFLSSGAKNWVELIDHWSFANDDSVSHFIIDHITPLRLAIELADNPSQILLSDKIGSLSAEWRAYLCSECQSIRVVDALVEFCRRTARNFEHYGPHEREPELGVLRAATRALAQLSHKGHNLLASIGNLTSGSVHWRVQLVALQACKYAPASIAQDILLDVKQHDVDDILHTRLELLLTHFPEGSRLKEVLERLTDKDVVLLAKGQRGKPDGLPNLTRLFACLDDSILRRLVPCLVDVLPRTTLRAEHLQVCSDSSRELRLSLCSSLINSHGFVAATRAAQCLNISCDMLFGVDWRFRYFCSHVPSCHSIIECIQPIDPGVLKGDYLPHSFRETLSSFDGRLVGIVGPKGDTVEVRDVPYSFPIAHSQQTLGKHSLVWFNPSKVWSDPNKVREIPEPLLYLVTTCPCNGSDDKEYRPCGGDGCERPDGVSLAPESERCPYCDILEGSVKTLTNYKGYSYIAVPGQQDVFVYQRDCLYPLQSMFGQKVVFNPCESYDKFRDRKTIKAILVRPKGRDSMLQETDCSESDAQSKGEDCR